MPILDRKHVNGEQVTEREKANSKQQGLEGGERVQYWKPFHSETRVRSLARVSGASEEVVKATLKPQLRVSLIVVIPAAWERY